MKEEDFLLKINKELKKYSNIPKDLYDYILNAAKKDMKEHLLPAIASEEKQKIVLEQTDNLFKKASQITKLNPAELLKALDFHSKDINLGRVDAAFAELRTIIFLNNMNFKNIVPLKAKADEKSADFIAERNPYKFAIEVYCRISKGLKHELNPGKIIIEPVNIESELYQLYLNTIKEKKSQLDNTAKKYSCDKKIMVMVLNDPNLWGLFLYHEYLEIIKKISNELNWGSDYYFAIVTGVVDLRNNKIDDIIYPSLMDEK